jgi:two-component system, OmpR family, response regulator PrrA
MSAVIGKAADVLVVDDDRAVVLAVERGLRQEGFDVRSATDGPAALAEVERRAPDVIVLDVGLPGLDGVSVTARLRGDGLDCPICILSARAEVDDRVAGLQAGADDYLVKPFAMRELVARLHALLRRTPTVSTPLVVGDLHVDPRRRRTRRGDRDIELTRREFELLLSLVQHPGIVLTRDQLLLRVWGYDFDVDSNVVDVFVGYLRRKLEAGGEPRMLHTVRGVGFVIRP